MKIIRQADRTIRSYKKEYQMSSKYNNYYAEYELSRLEEELPKTELDLLQQARYISDSSLGTIDVFSVLKRAYEQGKKDSVNSL